MPFPKLPPRAAYIRLSNPTKRNALSIPVLQDLKTQITNALRSPVSGRIRLLPRYKAEYLDEVEKANKDSHPKLWRRHGWLISASEWKKERAGLPDLMVLRSEGPVFSSGHDLKELSQMSHEEIQTVFQLCKEVIMFIRRSPVPVICPIQGLATAAGFQLAMSADFPIALPDTQFALPGAKIGLPCTSPSTVISRRFSPGATYRLLATADPIKASDYPGAVDVVKVLPGEDPEEALEKRVAAVVERLASMSPQQQAIGKWAYWTQFGFGTTHSDGYEQASNWAARVMALHTKSEDAKEGIAAFLEKREAVWISKGEPEEPKEAATEVDAPEADALATEADAAVNVGALATEVADPVTQDDAPKTEDGTSATEADDTTTGSLTPKIEVDGPTTTARS